MSRRVILAIAVTTVIAVAAILVGYSRSDDSQASFAQADKAVADLQVASMGQVVLDQRFGRTGISADPPSRRLAFLSKSSRSEVEQTLTARLTASGFTRTAEGIWQRGRGGKAILVIVTILDPGGSLPAGANPSTIPVQQIGAVLQVSAGI